MRLLLAAVIVGASIATSVAQQPTQQPATVTMTTTVTEAQTMINALSAMPWRDVNPLMNKLIGQINQQIAPPAPTPPATEPSKD
jgi:hypothetical protein